MFSNLVATLRADLDAIKDDLGEFVTTVKTDTTAILGINRSDADGPAVSSAAKLLQWEEELWDNPELLSDDPAAEDWAAFTESYSPKDEEIEALLSGAGSGLVPELYKELVPARTTHADFFKRLFYHRERLTKAVKSRMQVLEDDEEETGWDDDDEEVPVPKQASSPSAAAGTNNNQADGSHEALKKAQDEIVSLKSELETTRAELAASKEELGSAVNELEQTQADLDASKREIAELKARLEEANKARMESEEARRRMRTKLDAAAEVELPHTKPLPPPATASGAKASELAATERTETPSTMRTETPATAPSSTGASWEALPTSPGSSSNEEPVVLTKTSGNEVNLSAEEEEDDWE